MKLLWLALLLAIANYNVLRANPADPMPTEQVVTTADITDLEFNGQSGGLSFTWHGRRYIRAGRLSSSGDGEASVAAGEAILREMRLAPKVTLWVKPTADPKEPIYIRGVIFNYPRLHEPET